jgi:hypothetical protein
MKRWIALAAAIYPRRWREQFGQEFDALLDDVGPSRRVLMNVLGGAIRMQITTGAGLLKLVATTAIAGAVVSVGASFTVPPTYVSSAVMSVTPQPDPLRPVSPQALRQRSADFIVRAEGNILSRQSLATLIHDPSLDLYKKERARMPMEDVVELMRRNIRIEAISSKHDGLTPMVFRVTFSYPDRVKAQATVRALTLRLTQENEFVNRYRESEYQELWHDMAAAHLAKPAPPPPVADSVVGVLDPPSLPKESMGPGPIAFVAWGLGAGLLLGLLAALAMRHPRGAWRLGGFAAAGCLVASAASYLIPNRYTATAVMQIVPAELTEDPHAPIPRATPAAEFLHQWEPQVLSTERLSEIIRDPHLNLYSEARAARTVQEVVQNMRARDIRITPLNPEAGTFSISFSYPDPKKAVDTVNTLIGVFV